MSYAEAENPYRTWGTIAAEAPTTECATFIRQTYLHLAAAVFAFTALETVLLNIPGIGDMVALMAGSRFGWLIVLGAFMGVSYLADSWARSSTSVGMQYLGLSLYVVAESIIFLPILYIAQSFPNGVEMIATAAIITLIVFTGLTAVVFASGADFSFLRTGLVVAGLVAMGLVLCSAIFGFSLGIPFMGAMILLACGYILYDTSNVMHHYRIGQHVAASLALFASVALLFFYILRLIMALTSRD